MAQAWPRRGAAERAERLAGLLQRVTEICNETVEAEDAMRQALDEICMTMSWPVGRLYLRGPAGDHHVAATWFPAGDEELAVLASLGGDSAVASDASLARRAADTGEPAWVAGTEAAARHDRTLIAAQRGITGALAFPVRTGGTSVAVMQFLSLEGTEPDDDLLDVMAGIGRQLGVVVERQRAAVDLARSKAERAAVRVLATLSRDDVPVDAVLDEAVAAVWRVLGRETTTVLACDVDGASLELQAARGPHDGGRRVSLDEDGLVADVITAGASRIIGASGAGNDLAAFVPDLTPTAGAVAPILAGDRVLGVLAVLADGTLRVDDDDIALLESVANVVSTVVQRAEAQFARDERTKELGGLFAVGRELAGDPDPGALCERVSEHVRQTLRAPEASSVEVSIDGAAARAGHADGDTHVLEAAIEVDARPRGHVRVRCPRSIRFLLPQEARVVDAVADSIGRWLAGRDARDALRESEERLDQLMSTAPVGIVFVDRDGRLTFANPAAEEMLASPPGDLATRGHDGPSVEHAAGDGRALAASEQAFARVMETGRSVYGIEHTVRRPDGSQLILSVNGAPLHDPGGQVTGMAAALIDVTAARTAEEELRRSRRRLQALFDNAADAILLGDEEGRIIDANPAAGRLTGYDPEELIGQHVDEFVPGAHPDAPDSLWGRVSAGDGVSREVRFSRRDSRDVEVELRSAANILPGVHLALLRDVTDRRRAERALTRSEAQFRQLAENSDDLVYLLRLVPEVRFDYLNPATEAVTGFPPEAFYDDPDLPLSRVHAEDRSVLERSRFEAETLTEAAAFRWHRPGGEVVWLEETVAAVRDDGGDVVAVQGMIRDVTGRKRAEEAMREALEGERRAVEELQHLNEMKNTFLHAVSHELRTPLTSVLGYAVTLERRAAELDPEQLADFMGRIARSARRLDQLLTDLLDVDRMTRGVIEAERGPTDVEKLVRDAIDEIDIGERTLVADVEPLVVDLDAPKVERIVHNLVGNAGKHTPEGTTIWVRVHSVSEGVVLVVEDDGPGLPEADRDELFQPFHQGPSARSAASPGTGLGLSLVCRLVELHRGSVTAGDRPGGGARFTVVLPGASDTVADGQAPAATDRPAPRIRASRAVSATSDAGPSAGRKPGQLVAEAARQLVHVETPEEATGVLVSLVHEIGGWTVPLRMARASSLPLDLALGRGDPILPAADPGGEQRKTLEDVLPNLIEQARRTLRLGRSVRNGNGPAAESSDDLRALEPGALTRLVRTLGAGDAVAIVRFDREGDVVRSEAVAAVEDAADALAPILESHLPAGDSVLRSAHDAFVVVCGDRSTDEVSTVLTAVREAWRGTDPALDLSAGIARVGVGGGAAALARADEALDAARATSAWLHVAPDAPAPVAGHVAAAGT